MKRPDLYASVVVAGALSLAWLGVTPPARAANDGVQDELREIEREIETGRARQQRLTSETEKLARELAALRRRLVAAAASVQAKEDDATNAETRLTELRARAFEQRERLADKHERLAETLAALSRLSRRPSVAVAATPATAVDTFRSARLLSAVVPGLEAEAEKLRGDLGALNDLLRQINLERKGLDNTRETLDAERQDIAILLAEKTRRQDGLRRKSIREAARLNTLAATATDLKSLVRKLEAEAKRQNELQVVEIERRRRAAATARQRLLAAEARRARQQQQTAEAERQAATPIPEPRPPARTLPSTADAAPRQRQLATVLPPPARSFAESRGRLPMPVRGKVVQLYGANDRFGQTSKGIRLETRPNAQVVAPSDGSIMFAGEFRGYGLLLIISHGDRYHTLLAGMSTIYGTVGQTVLAGEPVGQMAPRQDERPNLYVELRRGGEPINPLPWMAANNGKVSG